MTTIPGPTRPAAWLTLAAVEARLIARNKTVAVSATIVPLALGCFLVYRGFPGAGMAGLMAVQAVMMLAFTVYMTGTMTLAARRGQLYLKRVRSSPASTLGIVAGLSAVPIGLSVAQVILMAGIVAAADGAAPQRPLWFIPVLLLGGIMCAALAFLTAAFTRTPEAAQITTVPFFGMLLGGAGWAMLTPPDEVTAAMLAVPGAATFQLARFAWGGPGTELPAETWAAVEAIGLPVLLCVVHAVVACLVAARLFSWQPRD